VTAKTEVKDWTHAIFNMGANSYITKPINARRLIEKVKSVLKMKHSRDELRKTRERLSKTIGDTEHFRISQSRNEGSEGIS
jgi:DNA-binding response OmpR family regulator